MASEVERTRLLGNLKVTAEFWIQGAVGKELDERVEVLAKAMGMEIGRHIPRPFFLRKSEDRGKFFSMLVDEVRVGMEAGLRSALDGLTKLEDPDDLAHLELIGEIREFLGEKEEEEERR